MNVIFTRGPSHGFHLVMTLLTGGLWLPVWWWAARKHRALILAQPAVVVNNTINNDASARAESA